MPDHQIFWSGFPAGAQLTADGTVPHLASSSPCAHLDLIHVSDRTLDAPLSPSHNSIVAHIHCTKPSSHSTLPAFDISSGLRTMTGGSLWSPGFTLPAYASSELFCLPPSAGTWAGTWANNPQWTTTFPAPPCTPTHEFPSVGINNIDFCQFGAAAPQSAAGLSQHWQPSPLYPIEAGPRGTSASGSCSPRNQTYAAADSGSHIPVGMSAALRPNSTVIDAATCTQTGDRPDPEQINRCNLFRCDHCGNTYSTQGMLK